MFGGCYNEGICDYSGIHMTLLKASLMRDIYFFNTLKVY